MFIYEHDLKTIVHYMDVIKSACEEVEDAFVHKATIELHNRNGYPIGVIECDVDDNWKFTAYDERTGEGGAGELPREEG